MDNSLRSQLHRRLHAQWRANDAIGRFMISLLMGTALSTVVAAVLESLPAMQSSHQRLWGAIEWFAFVIFAGEYATRLWAAPADRRGLYARPIIGRLRYAISPMAVFDLLAFAPSLAGLAMPADRGVLNVLRLAAAVKLLRYSTAMDVLQTVVYQERKSLWSVTALMSVLLVITSSAMFLLEHAAQPEVFSSIPSSMWWSIVTLTTVGYGDVAPITGPGKVLGGLTAILGLGMFAMPAAILANGFAREMHKRDFLVSWNLVARVPLFAELNARQIADIAELLSHREAVPDEVIFHRGDEGDGVYFVVTGSLRAEVDSQSFPINAGDFFGEIALLQQGQRTATVRAVASSHLLFLNSHDFRILLRDNPAVKTHVEQVAEQRMAESRR